MKEIKTKWYRLLRWSEQYTKTDMVYLFEGASWLSLGNVVTLPLGLLMAIAFANLLPQDVYGQYKYILSIIGIIGAFSLSGLGSAISRAVARGFEGTFKHGVFVYFKWSSVTFLITFGVALYYFVQGNMILAVSLLIFGSLSPFTTSTSLYNAFLAGKKEFRIKTLYAVIQNVLPALALLTTIFLTESVIIIISAHVLSNTLVTILLYQKTLKKFKPNTQTDTEAINYGAHLSVMDILGSLSLHLDKILVFHYLGAIELAIYAFSLNVPKQLTITNKILKMLVFPKLATQNIAVLKKSVPEKAFWIFMFSAAMVLVYIIAAPYIYLIFFPQYSDSIFYSQVFSLSFLFFPSMLFEQTLVAHMQKKQLYIIKTVTPLVRIVFLLTLLPIFGIWGAILSIFISKGVNFIVQLILFKKL